MYWSEFGWRTRRLLSSQNGICSEDLNESQNLRSFALLPNKLGSASQRIYDRLPTHGIDIPVSLHGVGWERKHDSRPQVDRWDNAICWRRAGNIYITLFIIYVISRLCPSNPCLQGLWITHVLPCVHRQPIYFCHHPHHYHSQPITSPNPVISRSENSPSYSWLLVDSESYLILSNINSYCQKLSPSHSQSHIYHPKWSRLDPWHEFPGLGWAARRFIYCWLAAYYSRLLNGYVLGERNMRSYVVQVLYASAETIAICATECSRLKGVKIWCRKRERIE